MGESVSRYRSIITRLTLMVTGILVTAVLVVGSLALLGQYRQLHQALATKATTLVQFMARVSPLGILSLNFVEMNNNVTKVVLTDDEAVYAIVLNERGIPLAHFFKDTDPSVTSEVRGLLKNRKPLAAIEAMKRTDRILEVTAPISAGEKRIGSVTLGFSTEMLRRALLTQIALIGTILVAIIGLSIVLLRMVLRRILHPVQALTAAATQISTGDLNVVLTGTVRTDELGVLSRAFESMAGQLRSLIAGLEQREYALRQLNLFQRTILDNAGFGIISTASDGMVTSFNHAAERMLGYTADEVIGKQTPACWHDPQEVARYALHLSEELGESIPPGFDVFTARPRRALPEENEWTFIRKDGARVPVLLSVTALRAESGQINGFVGLTYDLTERKRAEEALTRYKNQLEETVQRRTAELLLARDAAEAANQAKSVFLANMSHELRTPLNAILGFSRMVRRDPQLPESQRENLDIVSRSGEHLLTLINDVLEIAKIESGRLRLALAPFDLGSMVREVAEMMRLRAEENGLQLDLDQSSEFPRHIKGDEARLRQVLVNLVSNAVKFTERGGVTIRLGVKQNAKHHLLIEVEDTGPGISPEDQLRLFKPFVQLAEGGAQQGTGLGLAITRQFVQLMGGSIVVESTVGKGSLFRVELPVEPVSTAEVLAPQKRQPGEVVGLAPGQPGYRILIAEDQHENRLLLSRLMSDIGLEVKLAENGEQCVKLFQDWHPHLVWMDRRMPVMDGVEAARRIRQLPGGRAVKIVAVTASAFKEQQQEMLDAGMDDFVRKPYRFDEIYDCLARQLGVQYVYRSATAEQAAAVALTPALLAVLPAALRQELRGALESLDSARITAAIRQAGEADAQLGRALSGLAEYFDYPAILNALDEGK